MSFCYGTKQQLTVIVIFKIWCNVGAGRCWNILPTLQILPCVITDCLHVKEHLQQKQFELEDNSNNTVTHSSHSLSKDEHRSETDHLPSRWEKCVNKPGNYNE
jgi:hypothetical protein